jgi:REP element-mobilizing transposase RayT
MEPQVVKDHLFFLLAKYKAHYQIKIFDFISMDNHVHIFVRASSALNLGNFMRTVNSQLATFINKYFDRDSQAIKERYNSRLVSNTKYLVDLMKYIWLNRYKVNKNLRPEMDRNCSAYWRIHKPYKFIKEPKSEAEKKNNLLAKLLDDYSDLKEIYIGKSEESFIKRLINEGISSLDYLFNELITNTHTIGDAEALKFRAHYFTVFRRSQAPPLRL